jgi:hypothetical protein
MRPEQYQQIEQLSQAVLAWPIEERAAFLEMACAGDEELRREMAALLESCKQAGSFLETPPDEVAAEMLAEVRADSLMGQRTLSLPRTLHQCKFNSPPAEQAAV